MFLLLISRPEVDVPTVSVHLAFYLPVHNIIDVRQQLFGQDSTRLTRIGQQGLGLAQVPGQSYETKYVNLFSWLIIMTLSGDAT